MAPGFGAPTASADPYSYDIGSGGADPLSGFGNKPAQIAPGFGGINKPANQF
jgi:hypothetical protein